jgi:hypothetical protein
VLAKPLERDRVAVKPRHLQPQQHEVEPLGVLVVVAVRRRESGEGAMSPALSAVS